MIKIELLPDCKVASGTVRLVVAALALTFALQTTASAWGPAGHQIINGLAADALPDGPLRTLLEAHRPYLVAHSTDPDQWRDLSTEEGYHHYLDMDKYGPAPFLDLPRSRWEAERKYGTETVLKNGIVPWMVGDWFNRCVEDMRANRTSRVLMDSAILGHYAADSHVPFHAVMNYDGQLTDQKGIHARFETMLVNQYVKPGELKPGAVRYLDDPVAADMGWLVESATLAPEILAADKTIHAQHADYDTPAYRDAFWTAVGPTVTGRLEQGSGDLASLWWSAWIAAGKPALDAPVQEITDTATEAHIPHDRPPRPAAPSAGKPVP
ncbi:MAG: zinc dependent phospholipase C family protein [Armatimonadota bacterium]|nr:zinc dependent phospholipase C family protein [Armatimonadota bacterium]